MWRTEACRFCGAPIVWARTYFNGTPIPLNTGPEHDGDILVETVGNRLIARVLPPGDERIAQEQTYSTHFATCPDGDQWRRRTHA